MKILSVIYNNDCKFILDIVNNYNVIIETFNISNYREKKKAIPIMTRHGAKQVPLLVFSDENLEEYKAIWNESNPDWDKEINKILNNE